MTTIASIVTAAGKAAVSIIKISGEQAWSIAQALTAKSFEHRRIELAWIKQGVEKLDQVLVLPFKAPNSYNGEDIIEIHSHGGIWISEKILDLVLEQGARLAKNGEFTERAFLNHKLDLSQAEAILDLIDARTEASSSNAIKIYQGQLGNSIKTIRDRLINLMGEITACIDFPDEVAEYPQEKFIEILNSTNKEIENLLAGEEEGHILRHGYKVAIVGKPNSGKSTLLNALLKKERAIVTEIAGTTRDVIEESYSIEGIPLVLLDTAGIRESSDKVEQIGIEKSKQSIEEADLVLYLEDLNESSQANIPEQVASKKHISIGTKLDTLEQVSSNGFDIKISSTQGTHIEDLKNLLVQTIKTDASEQEVKINKRQADLLRKAKSSLLKSLEASKLAHDFWTIDLKLAISQLGEITGDSLTEEILDNIFSRFCIGK